LGQLDARLTEIDDLLIGADLGDVHLTPSERSKLETEAEAILNALSRALGKAANLDPQKVYEERNSVRELRHIAAVTKRHQELHPNDPEGDRIVAEAFKGLNNGTKTSEEVAQMITSVVFPKAGRNTPAKRGTRFSPAEWLSALKRIVTRNG
jgi:hypothetical protein